VTTPVSNFKGVDVPFADLGEVQLFFTDEGAGDPPLLLVHGYTCDSHDWSWQLPHFVKQHRVIAVDLRGHGRSSAPAEGYSAQEFAADLAALLRSLGVSGVVAIGHSLGGPVVSALAVEHPDLVAGLVCVDPGYLLPDETGTNSEPMVAALKEMDPVPLVQQMFQGFESPAWHPALRTWQTRRVAGVPAHVLRQTFEAVIKGLALISNSEPYLARRSCPVLSFYADPTRVAVETAVFADERSRAIGWEGAGHWLHQERPAEFNAVVETWIGSLKP
jgi:pimeloyl-ACP methyl ester carboxylesterase